MAHLHACHGISEGRAVGVIDANRESVRYRSSQDEDADLGELAKQRRRFGYRRMHILLRREA